MKKWLFIFIIFSALSVSSCQENEKKTPKSYEVDIASFESFFSISTSLEETNEHELIVDLEQLYDYTEIKGSADIVVYVSYMFNHINLSEGYPLSFDLQSNADKTIEIEDYYRDINVEYIEVIKAEGSVFTKDVVNIQQKIYDVPVFEAHHEDAFAIDNEELNGQLFQELDQGILNILNTGTSQFLTYSIKTMQSYTFEGEIETESNELRLQIKDNYLYYSDGIEQDIIQDEDGKLFHYHLDPLYIISNKQVVEMSVIQSIDQLDIVLPDDYVIDLQLLDLSSNELLISKEGNTYNVIGYLKDLVSSAEYQMIVMQLISADINPEVLNRTTLSFTFVVYDLGFSMTSEMNLDLPHESLTNISTRVDYYLSYEAFDPINLKSDAYLIEPPDEFIEITEETYVLEEVAEPIHAKNHKYLTYLETGQYKLIDVDDQRLQLRIYDLEFNELNLTPLPKHIYGTEVFIPEDGYYYLNIHQTVSNNEGYAFYLQNRNYETSWQDDQMIELGINEITFEGLLDIGLLRFDSNELKLLKLTFNNHELFCIWPDQSIYADGIKYIEVSEGSNYLKLIGFQAGTITVEITEVDTHHYQSSELESMEEISDIPSELIVTSENFGPRFLKLVISEAAYYSLVYTRSSEASQITQPELLTDTMELISQFPYSGMYLQAGTYILRFYSETASIGAISYEKTLIEHIEIDLDPTVAAYGPNIYLSLIKYEVTFYHKDDYVDFHVNSLETFDLYIQGSMITYQILDANKNPLSFIFGTDFYTQVSLVFHFEPGDYYIRYFAKYDYESYQIIRLAYVNQLPEDDSRAGSHIPTLDLGDHYFTLDYAEDAEIFRIEILEAGTYAISTDLFGYPTLFDSTFTKIPQNSESYNLNPGIYYIFLPNRAGRTLNIHKIS